MKALPIGIDAEKWITRAGCRNVLVAVHTVVAGQRLMDVVDLVESDPRVQLVYTQAPDMFTQGVSGFLRSAGALEIPWADARRERFDLALAAAYGGLDQLHAPVIVMPHGAGYGKRAAGRGGVYGLDAQRLMKDGRVLAATIVLAHEWEREVLALQCPEALPAALVAGDPCFDRMLVSQRMRAAYREALGVPSGHQLLVVTSTWGPASLFGRNIQFLQSLTNELRRSQVHVAALIHPQVWWCHGRRQVLAWLTEPRAAGMILAEPEMDWRAAVIAADFVIGDHGSLSVYAAALGKPVVCTDSPIDQLNGTSAQALLAADAPRLHREMPVLPQIRAAVPVDDKDMVDRLTSRPGHAHRLLRAEIYRLLNLDVPGRHRAPEPIPALAPQWGYRYA
ncbi:hypothetical protein JOF56_000391 [Kibdelosporangium banguiense]|uniref:CDP-Glycerol:Poly(Glycerophosphate) glycerophosphotransferase n=1 Tax=Kibdelosporangium banguiense TaxID=1365924 RepID=A0ABS4T825_9PSEU|nr:hypothetical protein [Kibdelosporangium banguiense]MBP2320006.1 hypothetical protein [Kibdelosporangium banguiense]